MKGPLQKAASADDIMAVKAQIRSLRRSFFRQQMGKATAYDKFSIREMSVGISVCLAG